MQEHMRCTSQGPQRSDQLIFETNELIFDTNQLIFVTPQLIFETNQLICELGPQRRRRIENVAVA